MLTSSPSPTPSGKSSPQAFRARSYQQSCRSSSSHSQTRSPRLFAAPASRRHDLSPQSSAVQSSAAPPSVARSSSVRHQTRDFGTQYSPPQMREQKAAPPAELPSSQHAAVLTGSPDSTTKRKRADKTPPAPASTPTPPTPNVRVDPKPTECAPKPPPAASPEKSKPATSAAVSDPDKERPPKRLSISDDNVKVMPLQYENCDPKDLGVLISGLLMELVNINDSVPLKDGQLTRFHSRAPPAISVQDYLHRLIVHATLSPPILLAMVYYIDRLCALYPTFTISSLTVHRFLIAAATAASKGLSDSFWTNKTYAMVGGVSQKELAILELDFLVRLEWRIVPKPEVLVDYYKNLVERGQGYVLEAEKSAKGEDEEMEVSE